MAVKKWRGKWVVDFTVDGRRIRRVSPVQSKRGAKAYEVELRLELTAKRPDAGPAVEAPTMSAFADEWMATYVAVHNKPSGRLRKEKALRCHLVPFFGKRRLDQITRRDIEAFKADQLRRELAPSTVNRHLGVLSSLMKSAVEWGVLAERVRVKPLPETAAEFDWLRPDEAGALLRAMEPSPRYRAVVFLALRTGMRKGEIFGLHWRSVDLEAGRITVEHNAWRGLLGTPKSGKTRVIPMTADLVEVMRWWRLKSVGEVVFPNRAGGVTYNTNYANTMLRKGLDRAELRRIRFHDLRHTFASHLVLNGCSLKVVQVLMGHSSVKMTERYAHVGDRQLETAVATLDGLGMADDERD